MSTPAQALVPLLETHGAPGKAHDHVKFPSQRGDTASERAQTNVPAPFQPRHSHLPDPKNRGHLGLAPVTRLPEFPERTPRRLIDDFGETAFPHAPEYRRVLQGMLGYRFRVGSQK